MCRAMRLPLLLVAAAPMLLANTDPGSIPPQIKTMIDAAIASGNEGEVATIVKYAGAAYLIYLAVHIAMSEPPSAEKDERGGRPMTFWGAAMFQWVNAKGWVMVIGTITAYAAIATFPWNIAIQVGISLILGAVSCSVWALFGTALRPILTSPRAVRAFNIVMALLLLASLYPVFMDA